jgi:hypothetical protein
MLCRVAVVRAGVSEELITPIIRETRIGELGSLAVNRNQSTLRRNTLVLSKRRFLQKPHGVTSQKTEFFIVTAVETSNLTNLYFNPVEWSRHSLCGIWGSHGVFWDVTPHPRKNYLPIRGGGSMFSTDGFCGLVVRARGYSPIGPRFDSRRYQIFRVVVGLERGPLSLVRISEELLEGKCSRD